VEERRLKSAQKHRAPTHLDVQSLMEAAFELRRKALEDNDSDFDDADERDGTWSDVDWVEVHRVLPPTDSNITSTRRRH